MKILITGGKSAKSYKILKAFDQYQVVMADYGEVPSMSSGVGQMISLGVRNDEITAHHILTACLDQSANLILPLHEFEIAAVSKSIVLFAEFGIEVLLPEVVDLPKYFYDQEDTSKGSNWAVFINGVLVYSPEPTAAVMELGQSKNLNGVFYISNQVDELTVMLFTVD